MILGLFVAPGLIAANRPDLTGLLGVVVCMMCCCYLDLFQVGAAAASLPCVYCCTESQCHKLMEEIWKDGQLISQTKQHYAAPATVTFTAEGR